MRCFAFAAVMFVGCAPYSDASNGTSVRASSTTAQLGQLADGTFDAAMLQTATEWTVDGTCELGQPVDNGRGVYAYPFMTGFAQDVAGGWPGAALLANDANDPVAHVVQEPVRSVYLATLTGSPQSSWLGLPVEDAHTGLTAGQPTQAFANGLVHWDATSSSFVAVATPTYVIGTVSGSYQIALGGPNATAIATTNGANGGITFSDDYLDEPWLFAHQSDFVRITIQETLGETWSVSWYDASSSAQGTVQLTGLSSQTIVVPVPGSILLQAYGVNGGITTQLSYETIKGS